MILSSLYRKNALRIIAVCTLLINLAGCGGASSEAKSGTGRGAEGSRLESFFPLVDGKVYAYVAKATEGPMLTVLRVVRKEPGKASLKSSNAERVFVISQEAIERVGGGSVLRLPLQIGASFKGDHGTVVIEDTDVSVEVPAGHYTGCLRTVEKPTAGFPITTKTILCPGVGIVKLERSGGDQMELLELQSYGDPVKI
jgi:hypothetical protein